LRWDVDFIYDQLRSYVNIKKIWVRGTPKMNEIFEKALCELHFELHISKYDYDIV
jgi:hypothetical protein